MSESVIGIVLCAGFSGRMNKFKPLLKLNNGKTLIQNITGKLSVVCNEVIVVTGFKSNEVTADIKETDDSGKVITVFNEHYESGMFSSLQAGLRSSDASWYLYHFVDQPGLPDNFYSKFINRVNDKFNWVQPVHNNKKGHPILFDNFVKEKILKSSADANLRAISRDKSIKKIFWEYDSDLIFQDIDTPEEFDSLLE